MVLERSGLRAGSGTGAGARGRAVLMVTGADGHPRLIVESALGGAFDTQDDERRLLYLLSWYLAAG